MLRGWEVCPCSENDSTSLVLLQYRQAFVGEKVETTVVFDTLVEIRDWKWINCWQRMVQIPIPILRAVQVTPPPMPLVLGKLLRKSTHPFALIHRKPLLANQAPGALLYLPHTNFLVGWLMVMAVNMAEEAVMLTTQKTINIEHDVLHMLMGIGHLSFTFEVRLCCGN
jgi:hypothetical protein